MDEENQSGFKALVSDNYSYSNILINPILKPISETDRALSDLKELILKDMDTMSSQIAAINTLLLDIPEYQESPMIDKLLSIKDKAGSIIKIYGLIENRYRNCIVSVYDLVKEKYSVLDESTHEYVRQEIIVPEGTPKKYIEKLLNNSDKQVALFAGKILELYNVDEKDNKEKFDDIIYRFAKEQYATNLDSSTKKIIAQIMRMEL